MDPKTLFSGIRTMVVQCMEKGETQDEKRAVAEQVVKLLIDAGYAVVEVVKNHKLRYTLQIGTGRAWVPSKSTA